MLNAHINYDFDVVVVQGIDNRLALLAVFDKSSILQYTKLVRYGGHAHTQLFGDVANAQLALKKQIEYFDASAVAHDREKFSQIKEMLVIGQRYLIYYFGVCFILAAHGRDRMIMLHYILCSFDLIIE